MTQRVILLLSFFLLSSISAWSIHANTAHTQFFKKIDSNHYEANITLTWRVQNSSLHFKKNSAGKYDATIICILRWSNDNGIVKEESFSITTPAKATPEEAFSQIIADKYEYSLAAGEYEFEMVLYEQNYKDQLYQYTETIQVFPPKQNESFLSEIQILDTFFNSSLNTIYNRNNFLDIPLSYNYFDEKRITAAFYYEVYNSLESNMQSQSMKLHSYISWKPFSAPVPNLEAADSISSKHIPYFFHHNFPLHELKSGNYYFNIELKSENGIVLDKKTLFFQRYNKLPISTNTIKTDSSKISKEDTSNYSHVLDLTTTFVGKYNAQQVRAVLKMLLLICTPLEGGSISGFLKKPDELYSKYFIYNFWEKRDKLNPEKAWKLYAEKIKEVNKLFGGSGKPGYETDRGRIYIQYGKPNDRIIVNNESGALPYEIWQYYNSEKQGQEGVFLFYRSGTALGGYTLLHSTFVGEKKNSSWRSLLYNNSITGSGGLNSDSQAEQYIKNR